MKRHHRRTLSIAASRKAGGFTLVELLIVIGIIAILVGILLPVISRVRIAARTADTRATITRLSAGIEAYFADFNAYPGPIGNDRIAPFPITNLSISNHPAGTIAVPFATATENMMLGLLGRVRNTAAAPATLVYDWNLIGQGPTSLNPLNPKNSAAYINFQARELTSITANERATTNPLGQWNLAGDSALPEMLDAYSSPQPILFMRANRGNPGIGAIDNTVQYNTSQLVPYGFPVHQNSPAAYGQQYKDDFPANGALTEGEEAYFGNPTLSTVTTPSRVLGLQPQRKDAYILISAGPDGIFGTKDDIRNFGNTTSN